MRYLLIDTCGDVGSLALAEGWSVLRESMLLPRTASAQLVGAVRRELEELCWPLRTLDGVAVVNGPGSFTGVRVGLAAAKGLCEVANVPLVTVSRLEVLLAAGGARSADVAVLDAGRGEFYVRFANGAKEDLLGREELVARSVQRRVLVAEEKQLKLLQELQPMWIDLSASQALPLAVARLMQGGEDLGAADANYVRHARALYAASRSTAPPSGSL